MRVKLEEVCERGSSNLLQKDIEDNRGIYPVYGAVGCIGQINVYHQKKEYVAVVKDGAGIGRAMILPAKSSVIGTLQYLIPNPNILAKYLYYVVKHMHLEKYFSGATIPHIYFKDYKNETFKLEGIEKQREIVDILEKVEVIIRNREMQISLLENLVNARFVEMFGDIKHIDKWGGRRLVDICDVRDGTHDSPQYTTFGYPLITSKNIVGGELEFSNVNYISKSDYEKINLRSKVDKGDILMPMIGTIGNPCIVNTNIEFAIKNVALIKFYKESFVVNIFLKSLLESDYFMNSIIMICRGGTQKFVSLGEIRKLPIPLPPLSLQNQFADFVNQVDKSKVVFRTVFVKLIAR